MSETYDFEPDCEDREAEDAYERWRARPMHLAKRDLTCNRCGEDCYWQEVIAKDGRPSARLFSGGKPHKCHSASTDEFPEC